MGGARRHPTPLASAYAGDALGSIELLDWSYPAAFSSAVEEHHAGRRQAGLFDFSFMAHFAVRGPGALSVVQRLITNDAARLAPGAALYSPICNEAGTFVDDCTVIRRGRDECLISAGRGETFAWLARPGEGHEVSLENCSADLSVLAVQGPASLRVLRGAGLPDLSGLVYFLTADVALQGTPSLVARIGYSGELGYELFVPTGVVADVLRLIREADRPLGLRLCGGRALDSLRIEAGYLMTQVDFDSSVTPFEARLGRFVRLQKRDFAGREALRVALVKQRLVGLSAAGEAGAARGALVRDRGGQVVGSVTSACVSPTFGCTLALAYVKEGVAGGRLTIDGVPDPAEAVGLPFYDPARARVRGAPAPA